LAAAIIEHETLDQEEVRKVIRGEKIRVNESLEKLAKEAVEHEEHEE